MRWLGLEQQVTPLVWSKIAEYGTMSHSFATAQLTLKDWGINISIRRIQSLTYSFCKEALSQRRSKIFHLREGDLEKTNILKDQRVVISSDGGRTRLVEYKGRKRNKKTNRRPYKGEMNQRLIIFKIFIMSLNIYFVLLKLLLMKIMRKKLGLNRPVQN